MAVPQAQTSQLKVLTFGAGAIGTYIGGSLVLDGHNVVFMEQPKVVEELRERGLRLDLTLDKRRNIKDAILVDPSSFVIVSTLEDALRYGPFDFALYALKSFDTAAAMVLEKLRGVGIASTHPLSTRLVAAFKRAFLNARAFSDADSMKWSKMLTNLLANPLSAILDMSAAEIYAHNDLYKVEIDTLRECLAVMAAQKIDVVDLPGTPVRVLAYATTLPLWLSKPLLGRAAGSGRGGKMPSFHIDLHSGRGKSEVDYLHGAVVRAGKRTNVPTPVNKLLTETLLALTNGEIPLEEYAHQPQKLLSKL
jgi:2-dehydropantoate 2-reductase